MKNPEGMLALLSEHRGRHNGISTFGVAAALHCSQRDVRHMIEALRHDGVLVCAEPGSGYFLPETIGEGLATVAFLRKRAMTTLVQLQKMERALIELSGQARLPT